MMRTLKKTVSWSLIAFAVTAGVTYWITGDPAKAGWIAVLCRAIKFFAYIAHESWWATPTKTGPAITIAHVHFPQEDYELESRRTVARQNYTPAQLAQDCC